MPCKHKIAWYTVGHGNIDLVLLVVTYVTVTCYDLLLSLSTSALFDPLYIRNYNIGHFFAKHVFYL